jgi:DNA-binding NtrC family response regulator
LRVWDEHAGNVDVLLTDMIMPGRLTGDDLINELRKRKPELKVIITSGYSRELIDRDFAGSDTCFLPKPYQPHMVAGLIRKTLDEPGHQPPGQPAAATAAEPVPTATATAGQSPPRPPKPLWRADSWLPSPAQF